jgi:hypothetical protein
MSLIGDHDPDGGLPESVYIDTDLRPDPSDAPSREFDRSDLAIYLILQSSSSGGSQGNTPSMGPSSSNTSGVSSKTSGVSGRVLIVSSIVFIYTQL